MALPENPRGIWSAKKKNQLEYGEALRAQMQSNRGVRVQQTNEDEPQGLLLKRRAQQATQAYGDVLRVQMQEQQRAKVTQWQDDDSNHRGFVVNNRQRQNPPAYGDALRAQMEEDKRTKANEDKGQDEHQGLLQNFRPRQNPQAYGDALRAQMEEGKLKKALTNEDQGEYQGLQMGNRPRQNPQSYGEELRAQMEEKRRAGQRNGQGEHQGLQVGGRQRSDPSTYGEELRAQMAEKQQAKAQPSRANEHRGLVRDGMQGQNQQTYADELRAQMEEGKRRKAAERQGAVEAHEGLLTSNRRPPKTQTYGEELRAQMEREQQRKAGQRREESGHQGLQVGGRQRSDPSTYGEELRAQMAEKQQQQQQQQQQQARAETGRGPAPSGSERPLPDARRREQAPSYGEELRLQMEEAARAKEFAREARRGEAAPAGLPLGVRRQQSEPARVGAAGAVDSSSPSFGAALRERVEEERRREAARARGQREAGRGPTRQARRRRSVPPSEAGATCGEVSVPLQEALAGIADEEARGAVEEEAGRAIEEGAEGIAVLKNVLRALVLVRKLQPAVAAAVLAAAEEEVEAGDQEAVRSEASTAESALSLPPLPRLTDLRDPKKAVDPLHRSASLPATPPHAAARPWGAKEVTLPPVARAHLSDPAGHHPQWPRGSPLAPPRPGILSGSDPSSGRHTPGRGTQASPPGSVYASRLPSPRGSSDDGRVHQSVGTSMDPPHETERKKGVHQSVGTGMDLPHKTERKKGVHQSVGTGMDQPLDHDTPFAKKQANFKSSAPLWEPMARDDHKAERKGVNQSVGTSMDPPHKTERKVVHQSVGTGMDQPLDRDTLFAKKQANFKSSAPLW